MKKLLVILIISMLTSCVVVAQNIVSVVNSTNTLKINYSDGSWNVVYKRGAKILNPPTGTTIYLVDINRATYTIVFANIVSPVTINKNVLAATLNSYLQ